MGSGTLDSYPLIADQTNATLGSELVTPIANRDLSSDTGYWTRGTGWTIGNGLATKVAGTASSFYNNTANITLGKTYKLTFTLSDYVGGGLTPYIEGKDQTTITANGTYNLFIVAGSHPYTIDFYGDINFAGSISNISVKQVNGNPAMMTNMTASDIENGSPYANIVQNSDFATDSDWNNNVGNDWQIVNGKLILTTTSSNNINQGGLGLVQNKFYKIVFTITNTTLGGVRIRLGTGSFSSTYTDGTHTLYLQQTTTNDAFRFYSDSSGVFNGEIDNVTVEEVNTGLQGYWKMGSGINDEYPVIYDQTNPTVGAELVTNGDFATDSDWIKQTGWTIANGKASISGQTQNRGISQDISVEAGKVHKVIYERTYISGNGETNLYSDFISDGVNTTLGSYNDTTQETVTIVFYFSPTYTGTMTLRVYAIGTFTGSIDNVSVKKIQGNPATMTNMVEGNITNQYPLTKIRNYYRMGDGILDKFPCIQDQTSPNLAHIPTTNAITNSETFGSTGWSQVLTGTAIAPIVTDNYAISPDGTQNAQRIQFNLGGGTSSGDRTIIREFIDTQTDWFLSVFLKSATGADQKILWHSNSDSNETTITNEWKRYEFDRNGITNAWFGLGLRGSVSTVNTCDVLVYGLQAEQQTQATAYIKSDGIASVRKATTTNLITYSEDFNNAIWSKLAAGTGIAPIVTSDYSLSPINTQTADRIQFNLNGGTSGGDISYITTSLSAGTIDASVSIYLKTNDNTTKDITLRLGAGLLDYDVIVTSEWQRFSLSGNTNVDRVQLLLYGSDNSQTADLSVWGVQLEQQTQAETYAPTFGLPVTIDLFTENNYGTMINMTAGDIVPDTPNN